MFAFFFRLSAVDVCFFKNKSSRILNKSDACIFFQTLFVCMDFFLFFPHPPHHFSNGPSLRSIIASISECQ